MSNNTKALQKAREKLIQNRNAGIKTAMLNPAEKASANPRSLRLAINAKCWDCTCQSKTLVRDCHITGCSLWEVRPWQTEDNDEEAVEPGGEEN
jgi:hypothetical protein